MGLLPTGHLGIRSIQNGNKVTENSNKQVSHAYYIPINSVGERK